MLTSLFFCSKPWNRHLRDQLPGMFIDAFHKNSDALRTQLFKYLPNDSDVPEPFWKEVCELMLLFIPAYARQCACVCVYVGYALPYYWRRWATNTAVQASAKRQWRAQAVLGGEKEWSYFISARTMCVCVFAWLKISP